MFLEDRHAKPGLAISFTAHETETLPDLAYIGATMQNECQPQF